MKLLFRVASACHEEESYTIYMFSNTHVIGQLFFHSVTEKRLQYFYFYSIKNALMMHSMLLGNGALNSVLCLEKQSSWKKKNCDT